MGASVQEFKNTTLTQIAIKRLSGKAQTSGVKALAQEALGSTVQTLAGTVFGQAIPNNPAQTEFLISSESVGKPGTVQYLTFDLVEIAGSTYAGTSNSDAGSPDDIAENDSGTSYPHAYAVKLPSDFVTGTTTFYGSLAAANAAAGSGTNIGSDHFTAGYHLSGSRGKLQLVPEYASNLVVGNPYKIQVFDQNTDEMSPTGNEDWYIDPYAGVLFVQDPSTKIPTTLKGFLYLGKLQDEISDVSFHFLGNDDGFDLTNSNVTASFVTASTSTGLSIVSDGSNTLTFSLQDGIVSSSAQIADAISGSTQFQISGSDDGFVVNQDSSVRFISGTAGVTVVSDGTNTITIGSDSDEVTFSKVSANIVEASQYIVSSSITYMTQSFSEGSTIFGDTLGDTHEFTGSISLLTTGSGFTPGDTSVGTFTWDTPTGNSSNVPLVYDAATKQIHTGSAYALSANGMSSFKVQAMENSDTEQGITDGNTIKFNTGSGDGLTIVASATDTLTFNLVNVLSSSAQIADAVSGSMQFNFRGIGAGNTILNNTIGSLDTASIQAGEGIDITSPGAGNLTIATNYTTLSGIYFSASVGGGTSIGLTETASFLGGDGITVTNNAGAITISSDYGELDSPFMLATGSHASGSSVGYGGTASFDASGTGLSVDMDGTTVTYTVVPDTLVGGVTPTTTFNLTASVAVSASVATLAGTADIATQVTLTDEENTDADRAIVFANPATGTSTLLTDNSTFRYNSAEAKVMIGNTTDIISIDGSNNIVQEGSQTTANILNTVVTTMNIGGAVTTLNIGSSDGTATIKNATINLGEASGDLVHVKGDARIDGDLIVDGTTTSINTANLNVEDQFILLASGSSGTKDGGIIVQSGSVGVGTAFYYDANDNRWSLTPHNTTNWNDTSATAVQYVVSISASNAAPTGTPLDFGVDDATYRGQMYVDTTDEHGLYIYF